MMKVLGLALAAVGTIGGIAFYALWGSAADLRTPPVLVQASPQAAYAALDEAALPFDFSTGDNKEHSVSFSMDRSPGQSISWTTKIDSVPYLLVSIQITPFDKIHSSLDLTVKILESPFKQDKTLSASDFEIIAAALDFRLTQYVASVVSGHPDVSNRKLFDAPNLNLDPATGQTSTLPQRINAVFSKLFKTGGTAPERRAEMAPDFVRFADTPDTSNIETGPFVPLGSGSGLSNEEGKNQTGVSPSTSAAPMVDVINGP